MMVVSVGVRGRASSGTGSGWIPGVGIGPEGKREGVGWALRRIHEKKREFMEGNGMGSPGGVERSIQEESRRFLSDGKGLRRSVLRQ